MPDNYDFIHIVNKKVLKVKIWAKFEYGEFTKERRRMMKLNKGVVTIIVIILLVFLILNFSHATTDNEIVNSGELNSEPQNPKVEAIQIRSPSTGTYSEEQNVYIRVYFDDKITGI